MALKLYFHPLSSFCWKVLIALYEHDTPFTPQIVDLGNAAESAAFKAVWPIRKFPVLRDEANDRTIPESSMIIEYLDLHHPGRTPLVPADAALAVQARLQDRIFDLYLNVPVGKVVTDRLRPAGANDPHGVAEAKATIRAALGVVEADLSTRNPAQGAWAVGDTFSLADCAAAPALFYANKVVPFETSHRHTMAYLDRLKQRPSIARVIEEAQPYMKFFPV